MIKQTFLEDSTQIRIAVNTMRSRLTVIGFNIAIVSFQIAQLPKISGGMVVSGIDHPLHIIAGIQLYMALALSLIAMISFIVSSTFDETGTCRHWTIIAGDLLMYMALAYTIAGFFSPLGESIRNVVAVLPNSPAKTLVLLRSVMITGGVAWFLAMYIGPCVSLIRSPFSKKINLSLGLVYVLVLFVFAWVNTQANMVESSETEKNPIILIVKELCQPVLW